MEDRYSIEAEIDLIRVCMDKLMEQISFRPKTNTDGNGNKIRDNHYLAQLNTLAIMNQSISTMIRTHYLTKGKGGLVEQGILDALEELRLEMGL